MDIKKIPTDEMIEDYLVSKNEAEVCERLLATGENEELRKRMEGNRKIMEVIKAELTEREVMIR